MISAAHQPAPLLVCPDNDSVTVACAYPRCGRPFSKRASDKRKKFCSGKCRVYASRLPNLHRRNAWNEMRWKYKGFSFDGRFTGSPNKLAGPLALFGKGKNHDN